MLVHANGIDIYYEKTGEGRPFLLLHGNSEDHTKFNQLALVLSEKYSVYALDTRCHGQSTKTEAIGYHDMMEDVAAFIMALELDRPILLGFSDGAITGLLLAIQHPHMLSGLIACGANTRPSQLKKWFLAVAKLGYLSTKEPKMKMMYTEPDISSEGLSRIQIPVLVLAGSRDIIPTAATEEIASAIPDSELKILKGQTHSSYINHYDRVFNAIHLFLCPI